MCVHCRYWHFLEALESAVMPATPNVDALVADLEIAVRGVLEAAATGPSTDPHVPQDRSTPPEAAAKAFASSLQGIMDATAPSQPQQLRGQVAALRSELAEKVLTCRHLVSNAVQRRHKAVWLSAHMRRSSRIRYHRLPPITANTAKSLTTATTAKLSG